MCAELLILGKSVIAVTHRSSGLFCSASVEGRPEWLGFSFSMPSVYKTEHHTDLSGRAQSTAIPHRDQSHVSRERPRYARGAQTIPSW